MIRDFWASAAARGRSGTAKASSASLRNFSAALF